MTRPTLLSPLLSLALLATTAGCTSQIDNIDVPDLTSPGDIPAGVYLGRTSFQTGLGEVPSTALIDPDGRAMVVGDEAEFLASGLYMLSGRGINAQLRFHQPNLRDEDGLPLSPPTTGDLIGTYAPQVNFIGSFVRDDGNAGSMNFTYTVQSETLADLADLTGVWTQSDPFGDASVRLTFDNTGQFNGTDAQGCNLSNARASVIDRRFNLYRLSFSRSCVGEATPQTLTGLMTVIGVTAAGRTLTQMVFAASNASVAVSYRLLPSF